MVGMVIVSHSMEIANGIKELTKQMAGNIPIAIAGGTEDGRLGTSVEKIIAAIESVYSDDGVVILFDLGSAFMNSEMAIEMLPEKMRSKVQILNTALVEGAVSVAIQSSIGKNIIEIQESIKELTLKKMC